MSSEYRKKELLALLGNCVIAIAYAKNPRILKQAQDAVEQHILELDRDYSGWREELQNSPSK
jgi:hypothetical protein